LIGEEDPASEIALCGQTMEKANQVIGATKRGHDKNELRCAHGIDALCQTQARPSTQKTPAIKAVRPAGLKAET